MVETANLDLPLLASSQAQKYQTVNEALTRLDHLVMLGVKSRSLQTPPVAAQEGDRYIVPTGATGDWAGQTVKLAIRVNGGWDLVTPLMGWRAYVEDEELEVVYSSGAWAQLTYPPAASGAISVLEFDHQIVAGGVQNTVAQIPAGSLVLAVTARVTEAITGASSWSLGVPEATLRYGTGYAIGAGVGVVGLTGAPLAYLAGNSLVLTPEGGDFTAGRITFNVHRMTFAAPAI